jgi:hypothetical protein
MRMGNMSAQKYTMYNRVNSVTNYGIWIIRRVNTGSPIVTNVLFLWELLIMWEVIHVWGRRWIWEISAPFCQFCCDSKTALKKSSV